jgi:hypothetical protein
MGAKRLNLEAPFFCNCLFISTDISFGLNGGSFDLIQQIIQFDARKVAAG